MRIGIVGAGEVGSNIAASLSESHDVTVIDIDLGKIDEITYSHDILTIEGNGTSLSTLREAGIDDADMLIASTDDDETNLVTCGTAKTLSGAFTIARVRNADYLKTWEQSEAAFGVDFMVSTNLLTANNIVRVIGLPAALDVDPIASGVVQMAEFKVSENSDMAGTTIAESDQFEALTFTALVRNGDVSIPQGKTVIKAGDKIIVIGRPDSVQAFSGAIAPIDAKDGAEDIVIVGGSDIGYHTAKLLEERGHNPRLIEQNRDRARRLAEKLPGTVVLAHDATDIDFLVGEHVDRADAVIAATGRVEHMSENAALIARIIEHNTGGQNRVTIDRAHIAVIAS